jgi:hypothetical protein
MGVIEDITGGIKSGINSVLTTGEEALGSVSTQSLAFGAAGIATGAVVATGIAALTSSTQKKRSKKRKTSKKGRSRDWRYASKQKHEVAYRKHRKKLHKKSYQKKYKIHTSRRKGVHYTKNGQPYILLRSGKARFIKGRRK